MILEALKQIGLNRKEAIIYTILLEIGSQPISVIAKKAKINRTTCYKVVEDLKKKGLISSFNKNSTTFITAEPVSTLMNLIKIKKVF